MAQILIALLNGLKAIIDDYISLVKLPLNPITNAF